jgi:hypothetical protein
VCGIVIVLPSDDPKVVSDHAYEPCQARIERVASIPPLVEIKLNTGDEIPELIPPFSIDGDHTKMESSHPLNVEESVVVIKELPLNTPCEKPSDADNEISAAAVQTLSFLII